ncbi:MAG: DinB family protein [Actinomycetes bacterium]
MTTFTRTDELQDAKLVEVSLRRARFTDCDLTGVVMRAVEIGEVDIDAPWLFEQETYVLIKGIDVVPLVRAELERRFPGRELMLTADPACLQSAWAALEGAWSTTLARAAAMPEGTVEVSVDGEWSFSQTLRHLVLATDLWLSRPVLGVEQPFHPLGLAHANAEQHGLDTSVFTTDQPTYGDVLAARADRVGRMGSFIAGVTPEELLQQRRNSWNPSHAETTLTCLHTILQEEWEHLRYAVRDLDLLDQATKSQPRSLS